jgi:SAM-dependent methyltransferase
MSCVCPLCSAKALEVYLEDRGPALTLSALGPSRGDVSVGRILRCQSCHFAFRQTRPSDEQLTQLYEQLDIRLYESESEGRTRSARRQLPIVQRFVTPPGSVLDIGCASGLFLRCAMDAGWEVEGMEPCEALAQKARETLGPKARIHCTTLQAAQLPTTSFDVVTLWDVLEHVPEPTTFLRLAGSLLKSGGYLFANVPDLDSIQARVLKSRWPLLLPEHLNYFNSTSLQMCGKKSGLQWVQSCQRSATFSLGYVLYRLQQHRIPGTPLVHRLVNSLGLGNFIIPVPSGEICGVWRH